MPVHLRPAGELDRDRTFEWANDPVTRAMSFSSATIPRADHDGWFTRSLAGDARSLFIAEEGAEPIGLVRLDWLDQAHTQAEIGISLAREARGRGLSVLALQALIARARELEVVRLIARIKPDNEPSLRAFARAGFSERPRESSEEARVFELEIGREP